MPAAMPITIHKARSMYSVLTLQAPLTTKIEKLAGSNQSTASRKESMRNAQTATTSAREMKLGSKCEIASSKANVTAPKGERNAALTAATAPSVAKSSVRF